MIKRIILAAVAVAFLAPVSPAQAGESKVLKRIKERYSLPKNDGGDDAG